jgi:hypothetical protein
MSFFLLLIQLAFAQPQDWGVGTLMGAVRRAYSNPRGEGGLYEVESVHFATKKIPLYLRAQEYKTDLVILLPGVFGRAESRINTSNVELIERAGMHVLSVPNFFSETYVRQKPLYDKDPVEMDLKVIHESLTWAMKKIGPEKINRVHLMAESLGSFMAAGFYAMDAKAEKRVNGKILLMWPPMDLKVAVNNFDHIIGFYRKYDGPCSWWDLIELTIKDYYGYDFSNEDILCARKKMLIDGFTKAIERVTEEFDLYFAKLKSDHDFYHFIEAYSPAMKQMLDRHDMKLNLAFWIDQAERKNPLPITIFSGPTDFLNWGQSWSEWLKGRPGQISYIEFSWGGHSGPIGYPEGEAKIMEWLYSL